MKKMKYEHTEASNTDTKSELGFANQRINVISTSEQFARGFVEDTPFNVIKAINPATDIEEIHLMLGMVRLNKDPYQTEKEVLETIDKPTWNMIVQVALAVNEELKNINS